MNRYLSFDEIIEINAEMVRQFGGTHAVRDPGSLHSAVGRPQNGYYSDVIEEAPRCLKAYLRTIHSWMATSEPRSPRLLCS